jgi:ABC-type dipeptide/oligopeptide/nickel transport system permease component
MTRFAIRRAAGAVVTMMAATFVVFMITFALPGDPARAIAGHRRVPASTLVAIRQKYDLDDPLVAQFFGWFSRVLRGDLGDSFVSRRPVTEMLWEAVPVTLTLVVLTVIIEVLGSLLLGSATARRSGRLLDHGVLVGCTLALSVPLFVVGSVGQTWLGVRLRWLPVAGTTDGLSSYLLPALTLALPGLAIATRLVRSESIRHLDAPHTRTARGKGLSERVVMRRHVRRNSLVPFVSFIGLDIGSLLGGAIVVERVFNLPGVGGAIADAVRQRDNVLIIGFTLVIVAAYLMVDLVVDLVLLKLDPRIELVE